MTPLIIVSVLVAGAALLCVLSPHIPVWLADDLRSLRKRLQIVVATLAGAVAVLAGYVQQLQAVVPQIASLPGIDWLTQSQTYQTGVGVLSLVALLASALRIGKQQP